MKKFGKRESGIAIFILLLLIFGFLFFRWLHYRVTHSVTDDAYVETDLINVCPLVSGYIEKVMVDESYPVKKNQILAKIEDKDYRKRVELKKAAFEAACENLKRAKITLSKVKKEVFANISLAKKEISIAKDNLFASEAKLSKISADYNRIKNLYAKKAVAKEKFDEVCAAFKVAKANVDICKRSVIKANLKLKIALAGKDKIKELEKNISYLEKEVSVAKKALEIAERDLNYTEVRSPIDGVVAKRFLNEGDFVSRGYPIFSIYSKDNIYIIANLEETKLKGVKLGNYVDIKADAYRRKFKGKVVRIGEASAAKFALIPRDVSAGEFTKVVQRIPIKIKIIDDPAHLLKPGMSVTVGITHR